MVTVRNSVLSQTNVEIRKTHRAPMDFPCPDAVRHARSGVGDDTHEPPMGKKGKGRAEVEEGSEGDCGDGHWPILGAGRRSTHLATAQNWTAA